MPSSNTPASEPLNVSAPPTAEIASSSQPMPATGYPAAITFVHLGLI